MMTRKGIIINKKKIEENLPNSRLCSDSGSQIEKSKKTKRETSTKTLLEN